MGIVIGYVSDLHLEVTPRTSLDRINKLANHLRGIDVLVVAGDFSSDMPCQIGGALQVNPLATRLTHLCEKMGKTEIVYVPGNHEYYTSSFDVIDEKLTELDSQLGNLHVLNNEVRFLKGLRFVGTTLWFSHRRYDVDIRLNDFNQISNFDEEVEKKGQRASDFLVNELEEDDIVVSHHLPTHVCVDAERRHDPMNKFYVHNHGPILEEFPPAVWFHGHSHTSLDLQVGDTRFLRNPYGYEGIQVNPDFDFGSYVEV